MKFEKLNESDEFAIARLTKKAGREFAYTGPATTRLTRQDKLAILKIKDPEMIRSTMENAFKMIIAAAAGSPIQQITVSRVNTMRRQIFDKLDQEEEKEIRERDKKNG